MNISNFHFTRGIRTYGKQEVIYAQSLRMGDIFMQFDDNELPAIEKNSDKVVVKINDILTDNREVSVDADLVVLVTGMVPRADNSIGTIFKIPKGRDGFFNEIHMKLRPVETVIDGITISGASQGPKNILESMNSALSAAAKSYSYVSKGELELEPIIAEVDVDSCIWCGKCADACPYNAIEMISIDKKEIAEINSSICKGCGMCLSVCPENALNLPGYSDNEIENMINALAAG